MNPLTPAPSPSRKRLLLDDRFVADTWNLRLLQAVGRKHPDPLLRTTPIGRWTGVSYGSIAYDAEAGLYKLWYSVSNKSAWDAQKVCRSENRLADWFKEVQPGDGTTGVGYAQSKDGIHWERPPVGQGSNAGTNIVFAGHTRGQASQIVQGLFPNDPKRKFTLYYDEWLEPGHGGHCYAHSADGIHWEFDEKNPFIYGESDSNNTIVPNPFGPGYFLYERPWDCAAWKWIKGNTRRRTAVMWSPDLYNWTQPRNILHPDEHQDYQFYGLSPFYRDGVLFGQLSEYHPEHETMDSHLIFSRDGLRWDRLHDRKRWFHRGAEGDFDAGMVMPCFNPIEVDGDLRVYYAGRPSLHNDASDAWHHACGIGMVSFPKGRLIGRRADLHMGLLLTHPFTIDAEHLYIDAQTTPQGKIEAELVEFDPREPGGKPIPGFSREDCDVFVGDNTRHELTWKGKNLGAIQGREVRLRLGMNCATVWSYTVE